MKTTVISIVALCALAGSALADVVSYDAMSNQPGTSWSVPAGGGSAASTGNRFLGVPVTLGGTNTTISGFDTTLLNNTGVSITFQTGWRVALNYWVWNTWTPATTAVPVFSNLAGTGSVPIVFNAPTTLAANSFFFFTQNASPGAGIVPAAATLPGIAINPVTVTATGPIGVTLNWTIDRNDGQGFVGLGGLTQVLVGGATAIAPTVGTNNFSAPNLGYYRSASGENNGNFLGNSSRQIGANSNMMLRIYTVPAPGAAALFGIAGVVVGRRRR